MTEYQGLIELLAQLGIAAIFIWLYTRESKKRDEAQGVAEKLTREMVALLEKTTEKYAAIAIEVTSGLRESTETRRQVIAEQGVLVTSMEKLADRLDRLCLRLGPTNVLR